MTGGVMRSLLRSLGGRVLTAVCVVVLLVVVVTVALPAVLGLHRFVITGGSMTGSIPRGSSTRG